MNPVDLINENGKETHMNAKFMGNRRKLSVNCTDNELWSIKKLTI